MANENYKYYVAPCKGSWLTRFISSILDSYERTSLCGIFITLGFCLAFSMMSVIMVGIGIGFHYCPMENNLGLNITRPEQGTMMFNGSNDSWVFSKDYNPLKYYMYYYGNDHNNYGILENNKTSGHENNKNDHNVSDEVRPETHASIKNIGQGSSKIIFNSENGMIKRIGPVTNEILSNLKENKNATSMKYVFSKNNRSIFNKLEGRHTTSKISRYGTHWYLKKKALRN